QLFLRTLDSPTPQQLTRSPGSVQALGWSPDSSRVLYRQIEPNGSDKVLSIGIVGGEPDLVSPPPEKNYLFPVSPDGKTGIALHKGSDAFYDLYISDPIGSQLRRYSSSGA